MNKIIIPFPIWDFLFYKQEEIARLLNEKFDVEWAPSKAPKRIEHTVLPPEEQEVDRIKINLWYPGGTYVTAVIGGHDSSYGVGWSLVSYKARWSFWKEGQKILCKIKAEGEAAIILEAAAHNDNEQLINQLKAYDFIKLEEVNA